APARILLSRRLRRFAIECSGVLTKRPSRSNVGVVAGAVQGQHLPSQAKACDYTHVRPACYARLPTALRNYLKTELAVGGGLRCHVLICRWRSSTHGTEAPSARTVGHDLGSLGRSLGAHRAHLGRRLAAQS